MLFRLLKAERMKLKCSPVWIAFFLMPVVPAVLGTMNYLGNIEILQSEWYNLWTQHTLFYLLLFPADYDWCILCIHYANGTQ